MFFDIFRIQTSNTTCETRINLASVYPLGQDEDIAFEFWKNHDKNRISQNTEKSKFNIMKKALQDVSIFDSIRKIHPDLDKDPTLQTFFKKKLRVNFLTYNEVMDWP